MTNPSHRPNSCSIWHFDAFRNIQARLIKHAGALPSSLSHLRWCDVDFLNGQIRFSNPKTGRSWNASIPPRLKVPLLLWREDQRDGGAKHPAMSRALAEAGTSYVFLDILGRPLTRVSHGRLYLPPRGLRPA